jgi:hypothetical protein
MARYGFESLSVGALALYLRLRLPGYDKRPSGWWRVKGGGLDRPLIVRFAFTSGKRRELVSVGALVGSGLVGQDPVTATALRLPLAAIVSAAARHFRGQTTTSDFVQALGLTDAEYQVLNTGGFASPRARPGVEGYPDEWWLQRAKDYRSAVREHPGAATKALAEKYVEWKPSTVRYWLRELRKRGLVPKAQPRGGVKPQRRRKRA